MRSSSSIRSTAARVHQRQPESTINIGLIVGGQPVFGIIYAPALDQFYATIGPHELVEAKISVQAKDVRLDDCALTRLATREPDPNALVAFASRSHASQSTDAFLKRCAIAEKRKASSSAEILPYRARRGRPLCAAR